MALGRLLVFEGGDGIGKSYLASQLTTYLQDHGFATLQLSFPGKREGSLGNLVYAVHHTPERYGVLSITPLGLQALHIAAHLDEIATIILPAIQKGTWIVLDRYWWSTWVYGLAAGADQDCLELLISAEKRAWKDVRPTAVIVVERETALREEHSKDTFEILRALYRTIMDRESSLQPTHILDNNDLERSKDTLFSIAERIIHQQASESELTR